MWCECILFERNLFKTIMTDDVMFDLLHMEITSMVFESVGKDEKETAVIKMENIGFCTGYRLVERLTKDWPRFKDELDTMKFMCKEFWSSVYKKQVDNLRTNHQGVYVLQDNRFRFLTQMSNSKQYLDATPKHLVYTCGLIRGALSNLGIMSVVTADVTNPPICKFQIQVQRM